MTNHKIIGLICTTLMQTETWRYFLYSLFLTRIGKEVLFMKCLEPHNRSNLFVTSDSTNVTIEIGRRIAVMSGVTDTTVSKRLDVLSPCRPGHYARSGRCKPWTLCNNPPPPDIHKHSHPGRSSLLRSTDSWRRTGQKTPQATGQSQPAGQSQRTGLRQQASVPGGGLSSVREVSLRSGCRGGLEKLRRVTIQQPRHLQGSRER